MYELIPNFIFNLLYTCALRDRFHLTQYSLRFKNFPPGGLEDGRARAFHRQLGPVRKLGIDIVEKDADIDVHVPEHEVARGLRRTRA